MQKRFKLLCEFEFQTYLLSNSVLNLLYNRHAEGKDLKYAIQNKSLEQSLNHQRRFMKCVIFSIAVKATSRFQLKGPE